MRIIIVFTGFLIFCDQLSKILISQLLNKPLPIFGEFFQFEYSENSGIAFGIPVPFPILIILNIILLFLIFFYIFKELDLTKRLSQISLSLIVAGGISNLLDRLFYGHVIDFIAIWRYPNFNLADSFIVIGVLLLITFYGKIRKARKHTVRARI